MSFLHREEKKIPLLSTGALKGVIKDSRGGCLIWFLSDIVLNIRIDSCMADGTPSHHIHAHLLRGAPSSFGLTIVVWFESIRVKVSGFFATHNFSWRLGTWGSVNLTAHHKAGLPRPFFRQRIVFHLTLFVQCSGKVASQSVEQTLEPPIAPRGLHLHTALKNSKTPYVHFNTEW